MDKEKLEQQLKEKRNTQKKLSEVFNITSIEIQRIEGQIMLLEEMLKEDKPKENTESGAK